MTRHASRLIVPRDAIARDSPVTPSHEPQTRSRLSPDPEPDDSRTVEKGCIKGGSPLTRCPDAKVSLHATKEGGMETSRRD